MEITLKVDPQILVAKSNELSAERTTISGLMDQVKSDVKSLSSVWESEASNEYQNKFVQVYDDIENVLAIVSEHISDLAKAAEVYSMAFTTIGAQVSELPTDGVFRN